MRAPSAPLLLPLLLILAAACAQRGDERSTEYLRAQELLESGRPAEAWPVIEAEAQRNPDDPATLVLLVRIARPLSRIPKADAAMQRALELAPESPDVRRQAAILSQELGRLGDAVEQARAYADVAPERAEAHAMLGEALLAASRPEASAEAFAAAVERAPDDLLLKGSLGRALVMAGRHEEGLPWLDEYLEHRPDDAQARLQRGTARLRERDLGGAEEDFRVAIRVAPHLPAPYHNLAMVLQRTGRAEEAARLRARHAEVNDLDWEIRGVERKLMAEPRNADLIRELVGLLRQAGRESDARRWESRLPR